MIQNYETLYVQVAAVPQTRVPNLENYIEDQI